MSEIILLKDKEWSLIDSKLCLVTDFQPLMGSCVKDGIVISPVTSMPYATLSIVAKGVDEKINGFVTHKIDFANFWEAFRDRKIFDDEEILMYWTTKNYRNIIVKFISWIMLSLMGASPLPKIILMICPKGMYNKLPNDYQLDPKKNRVLYNKRHDDNKISPKNQLRVSIYSLMCKKCWIPDVMG